MNGIVFIITETYQRITEESRINGDFEGRVLHTRRNSGLYE